MHQLPSWYDVDDIDALRLLLRELIEERRFCVWGSKPTPAAWTRRELRRLLDSTDLAARLSARCRRASWHDSQCLSSRLEVRWPHVRLAAVGAALVVTTAAGPTLHLAYGGWALMLVFAVSGAGALLASQMGSADQRGALVVILVGAVAMRLALLFVEPYLSTDIYRYIWDGRVQAAGINPYRYVPSAPEIANLRDAAIFPNINRADYAVTIYPPTAQAIFLAVTRFGESVVVMKLGLIAFEAGDRGCAAGAPATPGRSRRRALRPTPGTRCRYGRSPAAATWMLPCARC